MKAEILKSVEGKETFFRYDPLDDTLVFNGVKYHADFFRELGNSTAAIPVGGVFRVEQRADKVILIRRLRSVEEFLDGLDKIPDEIPEAGTGGSEVPQ